MLWLGLLIALLSWVFSSLLWLFHGRKKVDNLLSSPLLAGVKSISCRPFWQHYDIMSLWYNITKNMAFKWYCINYMNYGYLLMQWLHVIAAFSFIHNYLRGKAGIIVILETPPNISALEICSLSFAFYFLFLVIYIKIQRCWKCGVYMRLRGHFEQWALQNNSNLWTGMLLLETKQLTWSLRKIKGQKVLLIHEVTFSTTGWMIQYSAL